MHPKIIPYQLPRHPLCRIIRPEEVDAVCFIRKQGHYKNCIVLVTGSMIHHFPVGEEAHQSIFTAAENALGIAIEPIKLLTTGPDCEILYQKKRPANFWLSKQHLSTGQAINIRYGMRRERLNWRSSYQKLKQKSAFQLKYSFRQAPFLEVERCNILGIEVDKLSIFPNRQAPDYPINHYRTILYGDGTSQAYFDIKNWLVQQGAHLLDAHEREKYCHCKLGFQGITLSLVYPTRSFECYQDSGITFSITNERSYPDLLELKGHEKDIQVDQFIELPDIVLSRKYRELEVVKQLPPVIQDSYPDRCLLWIDGSKQLLGLSDGAIAHIIETKEIDCFFLQNVAPARGQGWSQFGVVHRRYGDLGFFGGAFRAFDYLQSFIEEQLQLPFDYRKEWYDA